MITLLQLVKNKRQKRAKKNRRKSLEGCPQKKGRVYRVKPVTPRKPNSAIRKTMWVRLYSRSKKKKRVHAYIPGERHSVVPNNHVLIRGGRVKDIPGMKYTGMRGFFDFFGVINRKTARSKYGVKRTLEMKRAAKKPFRRKLSW